MWGYKLFSFIILAFSLITLPLVIFGENGLPKIKQLENEIAQLEMENQRLRWEIKEMEREIENLRTSSEFIKRVARQEFGYVAPYEVVFIMEPY